MKTILCADTSTAKHLLLALKSPSKTIALTLDVEGLEENLIPQIDILLKESSLSLKDMDAFVLGAGPGSFMGLRLGFAAFKAWAWALKKPLALISSLEIMALSYKGLVAPTIDGKMGKVFCALFDNGKRLVPDSDLSPEEFYLMLESYPGARVVGFLGKGELARAEGLLEGFELLKPDTFLTGMALLAAEPLYLRLSAAEEALKNK